MGSSTAIATESAATNIDTDLKKPKRSRDNHKGDEENGEPVILKTSSDPVSTKPKNKAKSSNKRSSDEHSPTELKHNAAKRAKTAKSADAEVPPVEFEDISAEVDARLKEREAKRKAKEEKKRKRESDGKLVETERGFGGGVTSIEAQYPKGAKKQKVEADQGAMNAESDAHKPKDESKERGLGRKHNVRAAEEDDSDAKAKRRKKDKEGKGTSTKTKKERNVEEGEAEEDVGVGGERVVTEVTEVADGVDAGSKKRRKRNKVARDEE